ncbi:unnamed protein product [Leptosia nina]|uniref:Uncharacterized protein n=1 Tax=Leptosia nina TaxID=320188 RepID=A0AAV1J137_9NEOP
MLVSSRRSSVFDGLPNLYLYELYYYLAPSTVRGLWAEFQLESALDDHRIHSNPRTTLPGDYSDRAGLRDPPGCDELDVQILLLYVKMNNLYVSLGQILLIVGSLVVLGLLFTVVRSIMDEKT